MKDPYQIIKYPLITEKSTILREEMNKYTFRVDKRANKIEIKKAIETAFNVTVKQVNVMNVKGKERRLRVKSGMTAAWKKAIITLHEGQKIDLL